MIRFLPDNLKPREMYRLVSCRLQI